MTKDGFFLEVRYAQPRPASEAHGDPNAVFYEGPREETVEGVGCEARRRARQILAQGARIIGGRLVPRWRMSIRACRPFPANTSTAREVMPLYAAN